MEIYQLIAFGVVGVGFTALRLVWKVSNLERLVYALAKAHVQLESNYQKIVKETSESGLSKQEHGSEKED